MGSWQATGERQPANLNPIQTQLLYDVAAPCDPQAPRPVVAVSSVVIKHSGRYDNHRSYNLQSGCVVKDIESGMVGVISKLLLFNKQCYAMSDTLQCIRAESSNDRFPIHAISGNRETIVSVDKLSKPAAHYHHRRNNTYSIINLHAVNF